MHDAKRARSSITGRFVSLAYAALHKGDNGRRDRQAEGEGLAAKGAAHGKTGTVVHRSLA